MNDLSTVSGTEIQEGQFRDINIIKVEIRAIYQSALETELSYAVKLGRKLTEAKSLLDHGEWGNWIKENLPFSQDKATMMMKIYENYGASQESLFGDINSETFRNLGISQAFALLSVPEAERETFVKENDVESLSVRELKKKIEEANAERDALKMKVDVLDADNRMLRKSNTELNQKANSATELKKKADSEHQAAEKAKAEKEAAEEKAKVAAKNEADAKDKLSKAQTELQTARAELAEAKINPEIPEEKIKELERAAEEKAKKAAEESAAAAEKELQDRIAELEKKLTMSDPDIAVFKTLFNQMQKAQNDAVDCLLTIMAKDADVGRKLQEAMKQLLRQCGIRLGD